jgi:hypothetical protein
MRPRLFWESRFFGATAGDTIGSADVFRNRKQPSASGREGPRCWHCLRLLEHGAQGRVYGYRFITV